MVEGFKPSSLNRREEDYDFKSQAPLEPDIHVFNVVFHERHVTHYHQSEGQLPDH